MSDTRISPRARSQTTPPTWLRWVSGHTLTCAILAWASAMLAQQPMGTWAERLWSQLPLAALLCVLHGLTIALQRRGGAGRAPLALVALPAVLAGLLFVPLTLGIPAVGGTLARMITLAFAGALVSLALQPLADPDGRQSARIGASALTWALTALADSVLGPTMLRVPAVAPAAVLSGALSGAIGGLAGAWLAAGAWDAVRDMGEPRLGRGSLLGVAGRWLLGCALIGASVGIALEIMEPTALGMQLLIAPATLAGIIGAGGGLVRAWLRGESHRLAWRRAMLGMCGALLGFALAFFPAATFMYIYPLTAVLIVAGCVGLGAGVGQDIGAQLEAGPSPWWPIATTIAVSVALVGAGEAIRTGGFGLIAWPLWSGASGAIATLTAIVLAALAGGVASLPLVLLAARGWPPHRRQRHAR